jgi:hypothetical protein
MSTPTAIDTPSHQTYGDEWHEPSSISPKSTVQKLKHAAVSLSRESLRQPLDLSVEDHYHTHGLELTLLELERQAHRIARIYAASLQEAEDDGSASADSLCRVDRRLADPRVAALFVRDEVK